MGRAGRAVRPAGLVDLPQVPAQPRRRRGRRPEHLAAPGGPAGQDPRAGRAARVAQHHHPAGVPARPEPRGDLRARRRGHLRDERASAEQELLAAERQAALREAVTQLPPDGQQLIALLVADPPVPYAEISARLGIPVGSIGPTRGRCLDRMRQHPAIAALITAESAA